LSLKPGMANNVGPSMNVEPKITPHATIPAINQPIPRAVQTDFVEFSFIQ